MIIELNQEEASQDPNRNSSSAKHVQKSKRTVMYLTKSNDNNLTAQLSKYKDNDITNNKYYNYYNINFVINI